MQKDNCRGKFVERASFGSWVISLYLRDLSFKAPKYMNITTTICTSLLFIAAASSSRAALNWASSSNDSFATEANWIDTATGMAPLPDAINSTVLIDDDVNIGSATATFTVAIPQSYQVRLGNERVMTVTNSNVTGSSNTHYVPIDANLFTPATTESFDVNLNGTTTFSFGWGWNVNWSLNDNAQLTAFNTNSSAATGVLGRNSTLDFASYTTSFNLFGINYLSDSPDRTAFISKMTVFGQPAVLGVNLQATSNGGAGTIFTPIPEPTSALLFGLGALALLKRRRF
ncbi:MAG: PEP-CTERM sorting domain-containing protein [Akkermansiaceae bacterium]|nr:PEP-CTERM sorting domain-containing protein [Akkermansiaceae bacterium]